jgi:dTDP-4-amino-4,6-dideoxygalactose transaminase
VDAARLGISRDDFHRALTARGIPCTPFYPHTLYRNPLYQSGGCRVEPCPVAEECIRDAFWLPHRVLMGDDAQTRAIGEAILAAAMIPARG